MKITILEKTITSIGVIIVLLIFCAADSMSDQQLIYSTFILMINFFWFIYIGSKEERIREDERFEKFHKDFMEHWNNR